MKYLIAAGCVWVCLLADPCPRFVSFCVPPTEAEQLTEPLRVRNLTTQASRHAQINSSQRTSQDRHRPSDFEQD